MTDVLIQILEDVKILGTEITEYILEQFEKFDKVWLSNHAYELTFRLRHFFY